MIAHVLEAARGSALFDRIHVSTESPLVREIVERIGFPIEFMRSPHLADDHTPIMPVLFVALAVASGSAVGALLTGGNEAAQKVLREYMLWSTAAVGVILVSILGTTHYGGAASELTFIIMTTGTMGLIFIGVGLLAGTAAPVAVLFLAHVREQTSGLMIAALLILLGSAALRYALLMGPQQLQTLY